MYMLGTPQPLTHTPMLLPVATSPPARAIQARHHRAIGRVAGFLVFNALIIRFRIGGTTISAMASQYSHVMIGIA